MVDGVDFASIGDILSLHDFSFVRHGGPEICNAKDDR